MLRLRPYKPCDAQIIISWCRDETSFRRWTSDRYPHYPIKPEDMNHKYLDCNGDCAEPDNFYPMTAIDEQGVAGHLILRFTDVEKMTVRLGFVIVDDEKRGQGYGKAMLRLALKFAFEVLCAEKATLGVFEKNVPAYHCYKAVGFRDVPQAQHETCEMCGESWRILELAMTKAEYSA